MIVDPAPGALVRDPVTMTAVTPGATVDEHDPYWGRLIADGDLVASATPAPAARRAPAASTEGADK
ncbi:MULTISPECIES: DUF2635 domain-containing protein [Sphingomonas]|uniref:DUF2635 domain-containing protein n=1 Tax=Sphingomonas TaxID=13687 RepID=UPI0025508A27|nr:MULTISPECIES: DUF2635 domain-containing protein [Sphingomonas]MDK8187775.1 DUF2635 domain-containing protein [Sphingomonas zeae]MDK8217629.1 DUF2635 domain-containing protein [Sphingomonas sp. UMB7805-LC452B]